MNTQSSKFMLGQNISTLERESEELSPEEKRLLLAQLLKKKAYQPKYVPLSLGQQRIWNIEHLHLGNPTHNISFAYHFSGNLNFTALEQSLQEIVKRHEALRTYFQVKDGQAWQVILPEVDLELSTVDLSVLSAAERKTQVEFFRTQEAQKPFDLKEQPLWRFKLLQLTQEEYELLITVHHIIFDRWSLGIMMQELAVLYPAFTQDVSQRSLSLESPKQYADFTLWQQQSLIGNILESELDYWQKQLDGYGSPLQLPIERASEQKLTVQGDRQWLDLGNNLTKALKDLSEREGVSLFATLLTAFKILLYCYSGQEDLLVCSPVAGRHRSQTKGAIGYFNNLLPLRTKLDGNLSFRQLLQRVQQVAKAAYEHQELPIQKIADLPELITTSLTQGVFALQNITTLTVDLPELTVSYQDLHNGTSNFTFSVFMEEKEDSLIGMLDYQVALFNRATITEVLQNFKILLESLVIAPEQKLCALADSMGIKTVCTATKLLMSIPVNNKAETTFLLPRNEIELRLAKIWESLFNVSPIGVSDDFFALGGHSLLVVHLFAEIKKAFEIDLAPSIIFQASTIEQLANCLCSQTHHIPTSSLIAIQGKGSKTPLFCVPSTIVGIPGAVYLKSLTVLLDPERPVYALVQPEISLEEDPQYTQIEEISSHYIREIRSVQPVGPYFLVGHCVGGVVVFEMARQLLEQGQEVSLLAVVDGYAPQALFTEEMSGAILRHKIIFHWQNWLELDFKSKFAYFRQRLKTKIKVNQNPPSQNEEISSYNNRLYNYAKDLSLQALMQYVPKPYPDKMFLFRSNRVIGESRYGADLGWNQLCSNRVEIHKLPVSFGSLVDEPYVHFLAEKLEAVLANSP